MFWDRISGVYDLFEKLYNRKVYDHLGSEVAALIHKDQSVLECACGTGQISIAIAPACRQLTATDFSEKMLAQAKKKLQGQNNVTLEQGDITALRFPDAAFDCVVAGNVIHLLTDPGAALKELKRVCKPDGHLIIPTYLNKKAQSSRAAVRFLELLGASFKRQFDFDTYQQFFRDLGCRNVRYITVEGRMACCIAVIDLAAQNDD